MGTSTSSGQASLIASWTQSKVLHLYNELCEHTEIFRNVLWTKLAAVKYIPDDLAAVTESSFPTCKVTIVRQAVIASSMSRMFLVLSALSVMFLLAVREHYDIRLNLKEQPTSSYQNLKSPHQHPRADGASCIVSYLQTASKTARGIGI